jgi:hypothetical protein
MSTGVSIALIAIGAILTFALERAVEGINIDVVGIILMIVGAIGLFMSAMFWSNWGMAGRDRRRTIVEHRDDPYPYP